MAGTLWHVTIIGPEVLQMIRPQGFNQFAAALGQERLTDMNLANTLEYSLRCHTCEHHQRPSEIGAVQFAEAVEPHDQRTYAPSQRAPPAVLARAQVVLPTFHQKLPLQGT